MAEDGGKIESADAEVLDEEPRNLLLALLSEVRIGMDLSRVPLPTFVLEPRSMLEKLTDFLTHAELLLLVPTIQDPVERMVGIVRWYLSGFYIKPAGVKKPYNPILGEFFRCRWEHGGESITQYVAEQVSHHPPVSAIFASNRKAGIVISGSLHPRSKFLGTSAASILEGSVDVHILPFNEVYTVTFPSVYARGILWGTLLMEMCGPVTIQCHQSKMKAEIEFKAKPFWGGDYNGVSGKIKQGSSTLYNFSGKWDKRIDINNSKAKTEDVLWDPTGQRINPKIIRPLDQQDEKESQRLWINVTQAIRNRDQHLATDEKTKLEEEQRATTRDRQARNETFVPRLFVATEDGHWHYKYTNLTPYNPNEGEELEENGVIYLASKGLEATLREAEQH